MSTINEATISNASSNNSNAEALNSNAERQACYRAAKLFKTLPLDVQRSIERLSDSPEEKVNRTAIALNYQKMFPSNVHRGTGL